MKTMHKLSLLLAALVLALAAGGCHGERPAGENAEQDLPVAEVGAYTLASQEAPSLTEVVGTVRSAKQAVIAAKITGTIEKIPVVLGTAVANGDLLVEIRAGEISAQVLQAQAQLEQAKRNLERERNLLAKDAATAENVKSLEERYRIARAALDEAKTMLSYTRITAPFAGVITGKMAGIGDLATPGTPLLTLEDRGSLQVVAPVPEALVLRITVGDDLAIHIPAAGTKLQGTVAEIAPAADPRSRTAMVKINVEESDNLRSGQFARVLLPGGSIRSLFVPAPAVHSFGQMEQVFVIRDDIAHLRLVRTGARIGDRLEILSGLEPGEVIATANSAALVDGQPVVIIP